MKTLRHIHPQRTTSPRAVGGESTGFRQSSGRADYRRHTNLNISLRETRRATRHQTSPTAADAPRKTTQQRPDTIQHLQETLELKTRASDNSSASAEYRRHANLCLSLSTERSNTPPDVFLRLVTHDGTQRNNNQHHRDSLNAQQGHQGLAEQVRAEPVRVRQEDEHLEHLLRGVKDEPYGDEQIHRHLSLEPQRRYPSPDTGDRKRRQAYEGANRQGHARVLAGVAQGRPPDRQKGRPGEQREQRDGYGGEGQHR